MNIIEKYRNLKYYCKILDENRVELKEKFNIRIDNIYRMYTVYSIDKKTYDVYGGDTIIKHDGKSLDDFLTNKSSGKLLNGDDYFNDYVAKELKKLNNYLNQKGLMELFGLTSRVKLSNIDEKVIIEYKYLSTLLLANMTLIASITTIFSLIVGTFLLFIF